jgi:two-component system, cell cycle sensor histidine kinase and response regulator CckA
MVMRILSSLLCLPLLMILGALPFPDSCHAGAPASIRVVLDDNYPPYIFRDPKGEPQGILVDYWRLWERRTGIKVELNPLDWDKALGGMKAGKFDVIDTVFKTDQRSSWLDFTRGYAKIEVPAFFDNEISGIANAESLRGFVVAAKSGDVAVDMLKSQGVVNIALYPSYEAIILAAKEHKISVFVADKPPALYYLYKYGLHDRFHRTSPLYVGEFRRAVLKGNQGLLRLVEEGFAAIPPKELKKIEDRWYGASLPSVKFLRYPLFGAGALALLAFALFAYNQVLRNAVHSRTTELGASKELFETVYHSVNDAIFIHEIPTGAIIDVNQRMLDMFGCTREEALNHPIAAFSAGVPPYTQAEADVWMGRASRGEPQLFSWKAKDRDGRLFWIEVNMRLARIGGVDRILVTARDISERKAAEESMKLGRELFEAAFHSGPLLMTISDLASGRFLEVNDNFLRVSGFTREEVIGRTSLELGWISAGDRGRLLRELGSVGRVTGMKLKLTNKGGESLWCLYFGKIMVINGEQKLLSLADDITERSLAEEQLRQAMKMEAVGQLAGGVAHDYNNMLTVIIGSAELLKRHAVHDPLLEKLSSTILEAAKRSADLTRELLTFSRKGGRAGEPFDANQAIKAAVSLLEHSIDKNILIETRLLARATQVAGDPSLLQNALLNLGINARDAMPGGGTVTFATADLELDEEFCAVHAHQVAPGPFLEISVSDTGIGIAGKDLEHIFEPFFTTKAVGEGTGLGLAMAYGTVKSHNGLIDAFSEPGRGTTFKIYLPLAEGAVVALAETKDPVQGAGGILLVDDEPLLRELGRDLLAGLGYRVYLAENGAQALEVYAREKDDIVLVILDMIMPVLGGKETLQRLVTHYPEIIVLITSGFHHEENQDVLRELGAKGFLQKPYRGKDLARAVSEALAGGKF